MALDAPSAEEVQGLIAVSRKRALAFGLCLGKKPDGTVLIMHRIKSPEILMKQAKKAGESAKIACGQIETKGKKVLLSCEKDPPGTMAKHLKRYLKSIGMAMSVVIIGPDGTVLEQEVDEDDQGDLAQEAGNDVDPNQAKWEKASGQLEPQINAALSSGKGDATKLRAAWNYAQENAAEGDYASALKVLARLMPMLKESSSNDQPASDGPSRKVLAQSRMLWVQSRKKMLSEMKKLEAAILAEEENDEDNDPEDVQELQAQLATAYEYLKPFDGRLEEALTDVVDARDSNAKQQSLAKCRSILDDFSTHLKEPFFKLVDNENGYTNVVIADTAKKSISAIQKMLN